MVRVLSQRDHTKTASTTQIEAIFAIAGFEQKRRDGFDSGRLRVSVWKLSAASVTPS